MIYKNNKSCYNGKGFYNYCNYYDFLQYKNTKENIVFIIVLILLFSLLVLSIYGIISWYKYDATHMRQYQYIDLDNKEGIAIDCTFTDKSIHSGGMGTPICRLEDGTIIQVKQYKYIETIERK